MGLPPAEDGGDPHGITSRFLMQELPQGTTKEHLEEYFSTFGEIEEASVRQLAKGGVQGSIKFASPTMELRNMMLREQHVIQGSPVLVQTWKMHKMARGQLQHTGPQPWGMEGKGKPGKGLDPYGGGKGGADSCAKGKSGKDWDPYGGAKGKDWDPYGCAKGKDWDPYGKGKPGMEWDPYGKGKGGADGYGKGKPGSEWDPYGSGKGVADAGAKGKAGTELVPYGGGKGGPDGCAKGKPDSSSKGKPDPWDPYGYGKAGPDSYGKGKDPYGGSKGWGYEDAGWAGKGYDGYGCYGGYDGYGGYGAYGPSAKGYAGGYGYGDYGPWGGGYKGDPGKGAGWGACGKGWPASSSAAGCKGGGKGGKDGKDDGKNKDITTRYLLSDLPEVVSEDEIRTYFGVFAQIEEVTLRKIESNGKIMGSVKFATPTVELRDQMLKETHEILGTPISVQTWKMQKMSKPGYASKKEAESAKYFAQKAEGKAKGKGLVPGYKAY